jgi:hypothetical protein
VQRYLPRLLAMIEEGKIDPSEVITGFEMGEIDMLLHDSGGADDADVVLEMDRISRRSHSLTTSGFWASIACCALTRHNGDHSTN